MTEPADIQVLHVDDEPDFVELAAEMLEREDDRFSVETATSADEGLDRLAGNDFDCIVSDFQMPDQNGIEFLKSVRGEDADLPFILYTGRGNEEVASDALSAGATDYLQKGSGTDQYELLANRIQNAVEKSRSQRRAAELERVRTLVADVNQALVRANSRSEIETRICEIISQSDPYLFAWIGEVDRESDRIEPRAWAGVEDGYLKDITVTADETATGRGPGGTAIRERRVAAFQNIHEDPDFEPWRQDAIERGYQSAAGAPIEHEDSLYGVLLVYSDRVDAFDADERALLAELGSDIGHAIHAMAVKDGLQTARQRAERYFETAGNIMVVLNTDMTVDHINERGCDLLGYERSELVGSDWMDLFVPEQIEGELDELFSAFWSEGGNPVQKNVNAIETKSGEQVVVEWHNTVIQDEQGDVTGVLSSGIDITERTQKEQEIQALKERFDLAVEAAEIGIWDWDMQTDTVQFNDQWARIFGHSPADIEPHFDAWEERIHPDDLSAVQAKIQTHISGETAYFDDEHRMRTADGSWMWVRGVGRVVDRDEQGSPVRAAGIHQDIDERKQRERALEVSERRYRSLFESNPAVVWVEDFSAVREHIETLRTDVDDVQAYLEANPQEAQTVLEQVEILDVSEQALDRYGAPSKEALLANVDDLFTPEAYEANAELWRRLADGETHFRIQTVAETFDGDHLDEILDIRVPDAHTDDYSRVYLTAIDVTDRERYKRKLAAVHDIATSLQAGTSAESVYERTIEASREILEFDLSVIDIAADGVLRTVALSADTPERATAEMSIEKGLAGKSYRTGESLLIDDIQAHPEAEPQGPFRSGISVPIGDHGVFQAVAEQPGAFDESDLELAELLVSHAESALDRLEHEQQLERHNERLDQFASVVSHDLRNPLQVAQGRLDLAREECDSTHLDAVAQAHERVETLIDNLLTLAQTDSQINAPTAVTLADVLDSSWQAVEATEATLTSEIDKTIQADPNRLQQLLENLFRNAVEHGDEDVTIRIGPLPEGFYVEDDGPGIPEGEREDIWEDGYSGTEEGTGFGLAIVEQIVEGHGWNIRLTDGSDGGARFEITGVESATE
ncbi:PAS domain S-box protein [Halorhabdus sp. CUG00001]|uniref:PAS domain S-box protein n=1 Tax=Halorhabdus sp. CUG00001 TaxID=2600297 RepID=UPI0018EF2DD0|nr:PAS domain S-box protein [Halorhabdus sp. CUG00001]